MKAAAVQTSPQFGDKMGNVERALALMEPAKADLYVLPELFTTGYLFASRRELAALAEPAEGPTAARLAEFTGDLGCTLYAGFAEAGGRRIYNSSLLMVKGRLAAVYRKLHLFDGEKDLFDPADNAPSLVESPKGKLGLMICFDWVFPEMARSLALAGAQILLNAANLVLPFCQQAMITRSVENRVFSVLANRVGEEERSGRSLRFTGGSEIVSPRGVVLAKAPEEGEALIHAEISPSEADDKWITPKNHLFMDRRVDLYRLAPPRPAKG